MPWAAAGSVAGAVITSSAAGDAADTQAGASKEASMQQAMAAAQFRQDLQPWTSQGAAAQNRLGQFLGLGMGPGQVMSNGMTSGLSRDQLRQQLLSQYTTTTTAPGQQPASVWGPNASQNGMIGLTTTYPGGDQTFNSNNPYTESGNDQPMPQGTGPTSTSTVDEAGLTAAIDKYYADQAAEEAKRAADPQFGSLLRAYRNGAEFDSGPAFSFTGADLKNDPGYKFGLDQGTQGIDRAQASRGNYLSGAAMKEITRFNEDYAGTKFDAGFNRANSTYGTNLARRQNEWNTNLGAYNQNRNSIYDFLTGQSTMGQNSAARIGSNNQQVANSIGTNTIAAGNSAAAATIASGNALVSGVNQVANGVNTAGGWNNLLSSFNKTPNSAGGSAGAGWGSGAAWGNQDLGMNF